MAYGSINIMKLKNIEDFRVNGCEDVFEKTYDEVAKICDRDNSVFRKNGVIAILFKMEYIGAPENLNIESWENFNLSWVKSSFDTGDNNYNNIFTKIVSSYIKETLTAQTIIVMIPINPFGKVSCAYYMDGYKRSALYFGNYLKQAELKYGLKKIPFPSTGKASSRPGIDPLPGESFEEYHIRIKKILAKTDDKKYKKDELEKNIGPYIDFIRKYGSIEMAETMISSSLRLKYGLQNSSNDDDKKCVIRILSDGEKYMKENGIQK